MNQATHYPVLLSGSPQCTSQTGRPDDGTDHTSFFNTEYFVDLKPKEKWRPVFHENKDELIAAMTRELGKMPGVVWGFSQPISDNMEEAVSGVKGNSPPRFTATTCMCWRTRPTRSPTSCEESMALTTWASSALLGQPNLNSSVDRQQGCAFSNQCSRCPGCSSDCGRRQCSDSGPAGRAHYDLVCAICRNTVTQGRPSKTFVCCSPTGERVSLAQLCNVRSETEGPKFIAKITNAMSPSNTVCAAATLGERRGRGHGQGGRK